jgi:predicted NBD/HSP70 family sugar kinase
VCSHHPCSTKCHEQGVDSKIQELVEGDLERISIEIIAEAAQENDSLAFRVFHDAVSHIGVALADVVNLLNPGVVIFGGPLFRAAPYLLEPLKRVIKQRALERSANQVQLCVSNLGSEAGALGAARAISERVIENLYRQALWCRETLQNESTNTRHKQLLSPRAHHNLD